MVDSSLRVFSHSVSPRFLVRLARLLEGWGKGVGRMLATLVKLVVMVLINALQPLVIANRDSGFDDLWWFCFQAWQVQASCNWVPFWAPAKDLLHAWRLCPGGVVSH